MTRYNRYSSIGHLMRAVKKDMSRSDFVSGDAQIIIGKSSDGRYYYYIRQY